jgi:hypothetical protein
VPIDKVYTSVPATRALCFETQICPERKTRDLFQRSNTLRSIVAIALPLPASTATETCDKN